jgi:hypothetical protein
MTLKPRMSFVECAGLQIKANDRNSDPLIDSASTRIAASFAQLQRVADALAVRLVCLES